MTTLAALVIGIVIGAAVTWTATAHRRSDPNRDAHMFRLGVEAQKDAEAIGASKAHHPAYAGGPVPSPPAFTVLHTEPTNVIPIRRQGPDPAA